MANSAQTIASDPAAFAFYLRQATLLSLFTIAYNLLEGIIAISFGIHGESMSLASFGGDSLIEVASAGIVLWRFRNASFATQSSSHAKERLASRAIGVLFLLLAVITFFACIHKLAVKESPETTLPGLIVALVSLSFMYFLYAAKINVGRALNSQTMLSDAACSLACIKLSLTLFMGSVLYLIQPTLWWVDSVAALLLAFLIFREGWEIIRSSSKSTKAAEHSQLGCCQ